MRLAYATFNTARIHDWASFHNVCAEVFGFPDFYGRNMDAWIDCLTSLDEDDGMSRFVLGEGEHLFILVPDFDGFSARVPEIASAFLDCSSFVSRRSLEAGQMPRLAPVLQ